MASCNTTLADAANKKLENDVKGQANFEYAYKTIPYAGDINQDITTTFIGTFAVKEDGTNLMDNYMKKLPMQQTQKSCLINAGHLASTYITENTLDTTGFGGTFTPSTKKTGTVTRAKLIKNVSDTRRIEYKDEPAGPEYKKGLHLKLLSGRYANDANTNCFANPQSCGNVVELDTSKVNFDSPDIYLPSNFSNITTATSTNATPDKRPYSLQPNRKHQFMPEWSGYFKPNISGQWNFSINSDDFSFLWIDSDGSIIGDAYNNNNSSVKDGGLHGMVRRDIPQGGNQKLKSGRVNLTQDTYYRFRFRFGENWGGNNIIIQVLPPGGNWITDLTGLVFVKTKEATTKRTEVPVGSLNISYATGTPEVIQGQSLANIYNQSYTTSDPYPVYVSLEADKNSNLYNCYVNLPTDGPKVTGILTTAGNIPKYVVKTLWQSMQISNAMPAQGRSSGGVVTISNKPTIQLDGLDSFTYYPTDDRGKVPATRFKDDQHFLILAETQRTTSNGKPYVSPSIILYDATNDRTFAMDINSFVSSPENVKFLNYQMAMPEWAMQPQFLVHDIDSIGSNTEGVKQMNTLVQLNDTDFISSPSGYFRLLIQNGKLTLQAAIDPTMKPQEQDKIEYTKNDISPGTYAVHKVTVSSTLNQLNLLEKTHNVGYYVPSKYIENSDSKYTQYNEVYPNLPIAGESHVTTDTQAVCAQKCSENPECDAYYSYRKNGTPGCKLQSFKNPDDMGFFNPRPANSNISDSSLFVKNKEIKDEYNKDTFKKDSITYKSYMDLNNTVLTRPAENTKTAFYPDDKEKSKKNGNLNPFDTYRDTIYADWNTIIRENDNFSKNCTSSAPRSETIRTDQTGKTIDNNYSSTSMSGFKNLEGYTSLIDNDTYKEKCVNTSNGLCPAAVALETANQLSTSITENSQLLRQNQSTILSKVEEVDAKFKELSDLYKDGGSSGTPNPYAPDFNGYDDTPDQTIQGALKKDVNQMLLHENSLYVAGTIVVSSMLILAIVMART